MVKGYNNNRLTRRSEENCERMGEMSRGYIKRTAIALLFFLITVNLAACGKKDRQPVKTEEHRIPVRIAAAARGDIYEVVKVSGKISPGVEVNVFSKLAGKVESVNFDIGDKVKKGDVLFALDRTDLINQVKQAEAALSMAEANYSSLSGGTLPKQVEQAEANYLNAKDNYERMKALYEEGAVSKQQFESVELQYTVAKSQYESISLSAPDNLKAAEAQMKQAQAALELARSQLENAVVTSPVSGIVAMRNINPGEMASPGVPVFTIVNLDRVFVEVNISESIINKVKMGQEVAVRVASADNGEFKGIVTNISPAADPMTRAFPAKVELDNADHTLKGGMFAEILLPTDRRENVIIVPQEAVLDMGNEKIVFVIQGDTAYKRSVVVGIKDGTNIEIINGVKEGENVVVSGQNTLRDKAEVFIVNEGNRGESK